MVSIFKIGFFFFNVEMSLNIFLGLCGDIMLDKIELFVSVLVGIKGVR